MRYLVGRLPSVFVLSNSSLPLISQRRDASMSDDIFKDCDCGDCGDCGGCDCDDCDCDCDCCDFECNCDDCLPNNCIVICCCFPTSTNTDQNRTNRSSGSSGCFPCCCCCHRRTPSSRTHRSRRKKKGFCCWRVCCRCCIREEPTPPPSPPRRRPDDLDYMRDGRYPMPDDFGMPPRGYRPDGKYPIPPYEMRMYRDEYYGRSGGGFGMGDDEFYRRPKDRRRDGRDPRDRRDDGFGRRQDRPDDLDLSFKEAESDGMPDSSDRGDKAKRDKDHDRRLQGEWSKPTKP